MNSFKYIFLFLSILTSILFSQTDTFKKGLDAISERALEGQLELLASDWMEGRATGEKGIMLAGDYVKSIYKLYGIEPIGDKDYIYPSYLERRKGKKATEMQTYFQNFSMVQYSAGERQEFSIIVSNDNSKTITHFNYETDFSVRVSELAIEIEAPVVFVGYGYKNEEHGYNDFEDVEVEDKVILRLAGFPGHKDTNSTAYKNFHPKGRWGKYYLNSEKNNKAKELGVFAVIEVDLESDVTLDWSEDIPARYNTPYYEGNKPLRSYKKRISLPADTLKTRLSVIKVTPRIANELIKREKINFAQFEKKAKEKMESDSRELSGIMVSTKTSVESKTINTRNIVGLIGGENPSEVIVVGAHIDHVGQENGYIWNGSDDNASGSVGVMAIARACIATGVKPKKSMLFGLWTGEERGLLGSKYFVNNPVVPLENIISYINLDMISRNSYDDTLGVQCDVQFTSTVPLLKEITEKYNKKNNFDLDLNFEDSERPGGGSDHSSFSAKDIPILSFFTGFHKDYHGIGDHASKSNYDKMSKIVKIAFLNIWELANMERPIPKEKPEKK